MATWTPGRSLRAGLAAFGLLAFGAGHASAEGLRRWWTDYLGYRPQGGVENYLSGFGEHCQPIPYRTNSGLYGYQDYAYGRGPVIDLGSQALQCGFKGYGILGRHGYGLGNAPTSAIDQYHPRPDAHAHGPGAYRLP